MDVQGEYLSRSSRHHKEDDDEEALKWATLEKLPTYNRLRKGLLFTTSSKRITHEVDVQNLGFNEKKKLLERLINVSEEDNNEKFLFKLKNRIERVGIEIPTIEVRYEKLKVEGEVYMGGRAIPTLLNFTTNMLEGLLNSMHVLPNRKKPITILHDVSGIIKPKRMTLLLGPPSSGKTTLLLALAGRLGKDLKVSSKVTYNGHNMNEFVPERTAAYISQHDQHIGELTVRETLSYSARFQGVGYRYDMLADLSRREQEANIMPDPDIDLFMKGSVINAPKESSLMTDYILKILGLEICADTMIGNEFIQGASGGQRKRVTTGEMLVGPANAFFMDEISTGLDSSTTYQIVNSIRQSVHILDVTAVISLLQPAPETYDLFDDIILLTDGLIVYQGPREQVLEFFESMGFRCPDRKGVADFLQEVTSKKDQEQYWANKNVPYHFITPMEFAESFWSFHIGQKLAEELAVPFDRSKNHPAALTKAKYGVSTTECLKTALDREWLLMKRNSFVYVFKLVQLIITAFLAMSVFFRTKMHKDTVLDGTLYIAALFFGVTVCMFNGMVELTMAIVKLPVYYKHRDLFFFPSWAYALPTWILKIPIAFVEVAAWILVTYYFTGFDPGIGRVFKTYLLLVMANQMASGLFRAIAALARTAVVANTSGSFAMLVFFTLGGFVLSKDEIKPWWTWGYWVSPLMYVQNAVVVNEFLGDSWSKIPAGANDTLGVLILKSRGFFLYAYWYWIGVGALVGFTIFFNIIYTVALAYLDPYKRVQGNTSNDNGKNDRNCAIELRQQGVSQGEIVSDPEHETTKKGMVLPFEQHWITFNKVWYSVDMPKEMKEQGVTEDKLELLKGVSGSFRPGVLTALMGVSGAGKTTLMDVLAGRKTGGYIKGDIKISGFPKKQQSFSRISGYCEQNDIHSPYVTVYESLLYSAWLRLAPDVDTQTREMFVEEVMELVELTSLRGALVGLPGVSGLSTEQRKRLTIAVELVANPSIVFMDEPTSGLDARAAAIVMRTVRNTVDTGRTIVCTIHQPSIDIFEAFDELFLLKTGGQEIYVGPLGHNSCDLIKYFESIQGVQKITDGYNPATWMLEVSTPGQELALGVDFADFYQNSDLYRRNKALIQELGTPRPGSKDLHFSSTYAQPFIVQTLACLWKQHWSYWRNPEYTAVRFLFTTVIALIFGTLFWQLGSKIRKTQDLFNAIGSIYTAVLFIGIQNSSSVQPVVAVERTVFYREKAAGMYSALPFAFAQFFLQTLIEIPYIFVQSVVYGLIVYGMIGFEWSTAKFFWYMFFIFFTLCYFTYYGMMSVAITPNYHVAAVVGASFYALWNLFSGFLIPKPRIPIWWRWYYHLSPVAWTIYGLVTSQFGDIDNILMDGDGQRVEEFIKSYFDFHRDFLREVAVIIVGFTVLFAFTFAVSIKMFNFEKR